MFQKDEMLHFSLAMLVTLYTCLEELGKAELTADSQNHRITDRQG